MALPYARDQYLRTQVETASKEQLVIMLFDGIIRFTETARKAIENKQIEDSHHALMRAQAIVMELICTVDKEKGGEIGQNLMGLHAYAFNCLIVCNMKKDLAKLDEVQKIYRQLREGWVGAMDNLGIGATKPAGAADAAPAPAAPTAKPAASIPSKPAAITQIPKAPLSTMMPKTQGQPPANPATGSGNSFLASGATSPAAQAPAAAPKPVAGYGMGRTAMMGAYAKPAAAQQPAPAAPKPSLTANQAAMLGAYQANRSIA